MSRSYKKYPFVKCENSCKRGKNFANNKVRSYLKTGKEVPNGKKYKEIFNSWDICDLKGSMTFKEYCQFEKRHNRYRDIKEMYSEWYKTYKRK